MFENDKNGKILNQTLYIVVFCFGILLWIKFLNFGDIPSDRLDWLQVTFPRFTTMQHALIDNVLPLHIVEQFGIKDVTDRFFVIPDLILSPDIFLLRFLSIPIFILVHILICYTIGFWGLNRLRNKLKLSFTTFFPLFMLLNFNGFIISHIAVGHLTWGAYFLLPFFIELIWDIFNANLIVLNWIYRFSFLQFGIFLFGGYHFFVWITFFMMILFMAVKERRKMFFFAILSSFFLNAFKIIPSALLSGNLSLDFHTSFSNSNQLFQSLIYSHTPKDAIISSTVLDYTIWEINFYVGLASSILILIFSYNFYQNPENKHYRILLIPICVLTLLSIGHFFQPVFQSGLPILSGERVFTRFFILPLLLLITISINQYQISLTKNLNKPFFLFYVWILNLIIANDLTQHAANWEIKQIIEIIPTEFMQLNYSIQNREDPIYVTSILAGVGISIITFIFLFLKTRNGTGKKPDSILS
jgi:hypothetical protein